MVTGVSHKRITTGYLSFGCLLSFYIFYTLKTEYKSHSIIYRAFCQYYFFTWSSPRFISIGQLNTLPYLHPQPIYLVVFKEPYLLSQWEISS